MKNWNTNTMAFPTAKAKRIWELSQLFTYGFDGKTVTRRELVNCWPAIRAIIDPEKRRLFELLVWNKQYSLPQVKKSFARQHEVHALPMAST